MYKLFDDFGRRYDLHTPPSHYQHDHQLVLQLAQDLGTPCRLLDVGCGTGILLEKARAAGIEAFGIDVAQSMIDVARERVPEGMVRVARMQDMEDVDSFDMIVSLSWSLHYCADMAELTDVLARMHRALKPGGRLLLQVAHGPNLTGEWFEDSETGPTGVDNDVVLRFRFRRAEPLHALADYSFRCTSAGEAFAETHRLVGTDANRVANILREAGFAEVDVWDSWRKDPLRGGASVFVIARREARASAAM